MYFSLSQKGALWSTPVGSVLWIPAGRHHLALAWCPLSTAKWDIALCSHRSLGNHRTSILTLDELSQTGVLCRGPWWGLKSSEEEFGLHEGPLLTLGCWKA